MEHTRQAVLPNPKPIKYGSERIGNADFGTSSHCAHRLIYHVVLVTKFRRQVFTALVSVIYLLCSHASALTTSTKLIEVNGEADHIHLLIECPPTASLSSVVGRRKHISAKFFLKPYGAQCWGNHKHTLWNSGILCRIPRWCDSRNPQEVRRKSSSLPTHREAAELRRSTTVHVELAPIL
jgi:REP element-mobilizing transposase RayT